MKTSLFCLDEIENCSISLPVPGLECGSDLSVALPSLLDCLLMNLWFCFKESRPECVQCGAEDAEAWLLSKKGFSCELGSLEL